MKAKDLSVSDLKKPLQTKPDASSISKTPKASEVERLQRVKKQQADYARKVFENTFLKR